jgi:regulator of protease activity HflC (stomatin/prohibitin superfamily)
MSFIVLVAILVVAVIVAIYLLMFRWSINIPDYMAARHYRFGKPTSEKPITGRRCIVIPYVDQLVMIDQRIQQSSLDNISVLTKERQSMQISAMIVWKSENAAMTIENIKPEDIQPTCFKIMESVIKNECAKMTVDEILENRIKLAQNLSCTLKETTDTWGLKISSVNISSLTVTNEKFMRNMALPKEIEIERQASLAEIEKNLSIELKNIEKETEAQLAGLKSEKTIGEEKEKVEGFLKNAEKERIAQLLIKDAAIERITTQIEEIRTSISIKMEADRAKALLIAEAEGLEKRKEALANYEENALQYEIINCLPGIYKHLKIGNLTLFQNNKGGDGGNFDGIGYLLASLVSGVGNKIGEMTPRGNNAVVAVGETTNDVETGED